jgi:glycosyltransferase involved in cell wall biosynthesis
MKILMHYLDYSHNDERKKLNTYGGIGYYRIVKPSQYIQGHDVTVMGKEILHFGKTNEDCWNTLFQQYDVLWCNYGFSEHSMAAIIYYAEQNGKKFIMDVDDNYLDLPESNEQYDRFKKGKKEKALLSTALSFCDAIVVSTEPLKARLHEHFMKVHGLDKKIIVMPNMNDIKDWNYTPAPKHKDKIVIGYTGSNSHQDDLIMMMPSIAKLMKKYKNLHFEIVGSVPEKKVPVYFGNAGFDDDSLQRISLLPSTATFKQYPEYLSSQKWDIGVAPLVDTSFTRSKSHIKWMEYSMYKIPVVASRVYPYYMEIAGRETIEDGVTGFLCKPHEWEEKLERLILDENLRKTMGENAYNFIKENWQYDPKVVNAVVEEALK